MRKLLFMLLVAVVGIGVWSCGEQETVKKENERRDAIVFGIDAPETEEERAKEEKMLQEFLKYQNVDSETTGKKAPSPDPTPNWDCCYLSTGDLDIDITVPFEAFFWIKGMQTVPTNEQYILATVRDDLKGLFVTQRMIYLNSDPTFNDILDCTGFQGYGHMGFLAGSVPPNACYNITITRGFTFSLVPGFIHHQPCNESTYHSCYE